MNALGSIMRMICRLCASTGAVLLFILMLWGVAGIITRFAFNFPIPGQYEASSLLLVCIVYLGIANTQFQEGHIRMTMVIDRIEGRSRSLIDGIVLLVCFSTSAVILWRTGKEAFVSVARGEYQMGIYNFPVWPSRIAVAVGFLLLCITLLVQIWEYQRSIRKR